MGHITILNGVYKPTYNSAGGHHPVWKTHQLIPIVDHLHCVFPWLFHIYVLIITHDWLVVWNIFIFSYTVLGIVIPTDFHIFQRGRSTTNQVRMEDSPLSSMIYNHFLIAMALSKLLPGFPRGQWQKLRCSIVRASDFLWRPLGFSGSNFWD